VRGAEAAAAVVHDTVSSVPPVVGNDDGVTEVSVAAEGRCTWPATWPTTHISAATTARVLVVGMLIIERRR
jgi:hypothetical protein